MNQSIPPIPRLASKQAPCQAAYCVHLAPPWLGSLARSHVTAVGRVSLSCPGWYEEVVRPLIMTTASLGEEQIMRSSQQSPLAARAKMRKAPTAPCSGYAFASGSGAGARKTA